MPQPTSDIEPSVRQQPVQLDLVLSALVSDLKANQEDPDGCPGIPTGLTALDRKLGGMRRGSLIAIGGRPSVGQIAMALQIAANVALNQRLPVVFFSPEIAAIQLAKILVAQQGEPSIWELGDAGPDHDGMNRVESLVSQLNGADLFIDDSPAISAEQIASRARQVVGLKGSLGLIVVNDLQNMHPIYAIGRVDTDYSGVMQSLKALAQELNVPILLVSNLSRRLEKRKNKRPSIKDWPTGGIVEHAEWLLSLYRDELYFPDSPDRGLAELMVCRNSFGPLGTVCFKFDGAAGTFSERIA